MEALVSTSGLTPVVESAAEYMGMAKSKNTVRAYGSDWSHFATWCEANLLQSLPAAPATTVLYLTSLATSGYRVSTLQRRVSAISQAHRLAGFETPTRSAPVATLMAGIRRVNGSHQEGKTPITTDILRQMLAALPQTLGGIRDRALLLVGFTGAFRRSELVALDVSDLQFTPQGVVITIRRSKTDQDAQGRKVGIPFGHGETCPITALKQWLVAAGISQGAIFRPVTKGATLVNSRLSDKAVALIVKRTVGLTGAEPGCYGGHSLRSGFATSAAAAGAAEMAIMAQTGHHSVQMVRRYIRHASVFTNNPVYSVGL